MDILQQVEKCRIDITDKFKELNESTTQSKQLNDDTFRIITSATGILDKAKNYANNIIEELERLRDIVREFNEKILDLLNTVIKEKKQSVGNAGTLETSFGFTKGSGSYSSSKETTERPDYALLAVKQAELMKIIVETEQLFSGVHSASIDDEIRHKLDEWGGKIKEIKELERRERDKKFQEEKEKKKQDQKEKEALKRKEDDEKKVKEENERKRLEEEQKRKANEQKNREEELKKEEEEKRRRNPDNWKPIIYRRTEPATDKVVNAYHQGIGAVVYAIEGGLTKEQLNCSYSDSDEDLRDCRGTDGDVILGDIVTIQSSSNTTIVLDEPMHIHIPHIQPRGGRDVRIKIEVDGLKLWQRIKKAKDRHIDDILTLPLAGCEINGFKTLKIAAVEVRNSIELNYIGQKVTCDIPTNENVKVTLQASNQQIKAKILIEHDQLNPKQFRSSQKLHNELVDVISPKACFSISTDVPLSSTQIEITLANQTEKAVKAVHKGKNYWEVMNAVQEGNSIVWKLPDKLEASECIVALAVPSNTSNEKICKAADAFFQHIEHHPVQIICRQKQNDRNTAVLECIPSTSFADRNEQLKSEGFSISTKPGESLELCITDGRQFRLESYGNVQARFGPNNDEKAYLVYNISKEIPRVPMQLMVEDKHFQSREPEFHGTLTWNVFDIGNNTAAGGSFKMALPKLMPKVVKTRKLTWKHVTLSQFITKTLLKERTRHWTSVFSKLDCELVDKIQSRHPNSGNEEQCTAFLKAFFENSANEVDLIINCLNKERLHNVANTVQKFSIQHPAIFDEKHCTKLTEKIGKEWKFLGIQLGLTSAIIDKIEHSHKHNANDMVFDMLKKVRSCADLIENGHRLEDYLIHAAKEAKSDPSLIELITATLNTETQE